ncbi:hypothetical protein C5B73_01305 [Nocardia cyriacigeorgica]|nr:hypothetical protein C5B73_01305 [Nocardia cyriacigeorgica]
MAPVLRLRLPSVCATTVRCAPSIRSVRGHRLLVRTGDVPAIELPADRARAVLDRLPVPAPVMVVHDNPFGTRWVLLTGRG